MPSRSVEVINDVGLHATPLAQLVTLARSFTDTTIRIRHGEKEADGKSLFGLLALEALQGTVIEITTEGPHAEEALQSLASLIASGFQRHAG